MISARDLCSYLNPSLLAQWNVVLIAGAEEPVYEPAADLSPGRIYFRGDLVRSALHELAHWCVAGPGRRTLPDYGYWYRPDGRSPSEQEEFFRVEVRPQAIEKLFTDALGVPFEVSCDNLGARDPIDTSIFTERVNLMAVEIARDGLSPRAREIVRLLRAFKQLAPHPTLPFSESQSEPRVLQFSV